MLLSLIIPTLNERESVPRLFTELDAAARALAGSASLEAIVVDDGSTDGTADAVRSLRLSFPVSVIERTERGLATAVLAGFAASRGEILGVMDADLSHPPALLPELLAAIAGGADIAVGSRHAPGGVVEEWPWYRFALSDAALKLTRTLGVSVHDPLSGYFLLRREVIAGAELSPVGYKILLELLVKGRHRSVVEVPYTFRNRDVGRSKMGMREGVNFLRHLGKLLAWRAATKRLERPYVRS